jgi:hypothetical protein
MTNERRLEGFVLSDVSELEIVRGLVKQARKEPRYVYLTGRTYLTPEEDKRLRYHFRMLQELMASGILYPRYKHREQSD